MHVGAGSWEHRGQNGWDDCHAPSGMEGCFVVFGQHAGLLPLIERYNIGRIRGRICNPTIPEGQELTRMRVPVLEQHLRLMLFGSCRRSPPQFLALSSHLREAPLALLGLVVVSRGWVAHPGEAVNLHRLPRLLPLTGGWPVVLPLPGCMIASRSCSRRLRRRLLWCRHRLRDRWLLRRQLLRSR